MPNLKSKNIDVDKIDTKVLSSLVEENESMRRMLLEVSAVATSMMFHTHRHDCSNYTRDFLKAIVSISHEIEAKRIETIYKDAYDLASAPGVVHQFSSINEG